MPEPTVSPPGVDTRVTVTVNGRELTVDAGLTLMQALTKEGISVPSLCHDVRLKRSNGSCGLCVVEAAVDGGEPGQARDVKACLTPVQAGMSIRTDTPRLEEYRKVRLEQILCDHNADCV